MEHPNENTTASLTSVFPPWAVRLTRALLIFSVLYAGGTLLLLQVTDAVFLFMVWNLFLGALPLFFAYLVLRREQLQRRKPLTILFFLMWLFFFPNAPYLITDLIHVSRFDFFKAVTPYTASSFSDSLSSWVGLCHIAAGVFIGVTMGVLSLHLLHLALKKRFPGRAAWAFPILASALSGIAVFIGRFLRFNSWDLFLSPLLTLQEIFSHISPSALLLSLLFGLMTFALYLLYYFSFPSDSAPQAEKAPIPKE